MFMLGVFSAWKMFKCEIKCEQIYVQGQIITMLNVCLYKINHLKGPFMKTHENLWILRTTGVLLRETKMFTMKRYFT